MHALPRGDSAISTSGSLGLWIAAALVGTLAVAGGDIISRRDRRVLGDHPPSFRASIEARGLEMSVTQLAAESPRLFPMGLRIALDGAQLTSLMETNGFRPVPLTPWGGTYSAVVSNSAGGVEVVILYKQGKRSSSLWWRLLERRTESRREDALALEVDRVLICDTNAFATTLWHRRYMGFGNAAVEAVARRGRCDL